MPQVLWIHFFSLILFILYTCWILNWHYYQFVVIKQHYMIRGLYSYRSEVRIIRALAEWRTSLTGDGVNIWRKMQDEDEGIKRHKTDIFTAMAKGIRRVKG